MTLLFFSKDTPLKTFFEECYDGHNLDEEDKEVLLFNFILP